MRIGFHLVRFDFPETPASTAATLAAVGRTADEVGLDNLSLMDHYFQIRPLGPPPDPMIEGYTGLGFLAAHTETVELQLLVSGVTYRHPGLLAKIVATLDVLSGGRAVLGLGAAWNELEHNALGVPFPSLKERFERLEETLQICLQMWSGDEKPFNGKHYQLQRPLNSPLPLTKPHPPIMVGGGGEQKTLRLVAKYADMCNLFGGPDLEHKLDVLREHCAREGRDYDSVRKTVYYRFDVGANGERVPQTIEELRHLASLGVDLALGQVADVYSIRPLEIIGQQVIPALA